MDQMECIPGEGASFDYENLTITVTKTDDHRVEFVSVEVHERTGEQDA